MGFKLNPFTGNLDVVLSPAELGGSFATIQPDAGTSPTATSPTDTLTLTSADGSIAITGNSSTDTIDFSYYRPDLARGTQVVTSLATLAVSFGTAANVLGDLIFVYAAVAPRLNIYDVSNPNNIVLVSATTLVGTFTTFYLSLFQNSLIGFNNSGSRLYIIDITNKAAPVLQLNTTSFSGNGAFNVMDGAYLLSPGASNLNIYQILNPVTASASVRRITQFGISGSGANKGCALSNNTFFYYNNASNAIASVDITDKFVPVAVSSVSITGGGLDRLQVMLVSGNYLYCIGEDTTNNTNRLIVINISNPSSMVIESDTDTGYGPTLVSCADIAYPFIYIGSDSFNFIYNIEDPTTPILAGELNSSNALGLGVSGRYVSAASLSETTVEDMSGDTFGNLNAGAANIGNLQVKKLVNGSSGFFGSVSIRNEMTIGKDIITFGSTDTKKEVMAYAGRDVVRYGFMMG